MTQLRPVSVPQKNASRLRVALFSGNYNYTRDGSNRTLNKLAGRLLERGAAVRVYSPTTDRPAFDHVGDLVSVPSVAIPGRPDFRVALGLPHHVRNDVDRFTPNIVHVSAPDFLGTGAQRYASKNAIPVVASFHTRFESYLEYYRLGLFRDWARARQSQFYRSSQRVLAPNIAIFDTLHELGVQKEKIRLWSRGVDKSKFSANHRDFNWRRANGIKDRDVVVTFLGRLVLEKGIRLFTSVLQSLAWRGCKMRALVIGSGPAEDTFRTLMPDGLFVGHLDGMELSTALASGDILLHTSKTEAFGNVILEAMASGLAVVSSDEPSARALISDRLDGLLVNRCVSDLASGVQWLVEQHASREAIRQAASRTAAGYQWDSINDAAIETYLEITPQAERADPLQR